MTDRRMFFQTACSDMEDILVLESDEPVLALPAPKPVKAIVSQSFTASFRSNASYMMLGDYDERLAAYRRSLEKPQP